MPFASLLRRLIPIPSHQGSLRRRRPRSELGGLPCRRPKVVGLVLSGLAVMPTVAQFVVFLGHRCRDVKDVSAAARAPGEQEHLASMPRPSYRARKGARIAPCNCVYLLPTTRPSSRRWCSAADCQAPVATDAPGEKPPSMPLRMHPLFDRQLAVDGDLCPRKELLPDTIHDLNHLILLHQSFKAQGCSQTSHHEALYMSIAVDVHQLSQLGSVTVSSVPLSASTGFKSCAKSAQKRKKERKEKEGGGAERGAGRASMDCGKFQG